VGGSKGIAIAASLAALTVPVSAAAATTGGTAPPSGRTTAPTTTGGAQYTPPPPVSDQPPALPGAARIDTAGKAHAPAGAPLAVVRAIRAGNKLQGKPYRYGGGHRAFKDTAYDCSGTVSFALHGAKLLRAPLDSGSLMSWGLAGAGRWITVYANAGHTYAVIAGLRLDTSGTGGSGPRWQTLQRDPTGFVARHPTGL
jgi:cell wall-associated NlpC family hydrolase